MDSGKADYELESKGQCPDYVLVYAHDHRRVHVVRVELKHLLVVVPRSEGQLQGGTEAPLNHGDIYRFQAACPASSEERIRVVGVDLQLAVCLIKGFVGQGLDLVPDFR